MKGGRIAGHRRLRYESTLYPTLYWLANGASSSTQTGDLGFAFDDDTFWFGWDDGFDGSVIGTVAFYLYDADTSALIKICSASVH